MVTILKFLLWVVTTSHWCSFATQVAFPFIFHGLSRTHPCIGCSGEHVHVTSSVLCNVSLSSYLSVWNRICCINYTDHREWPLSYSSYLLGNSDLGQRVVSDSNRAIHTPSQGFSDLEIRKAVIFLHWWNLNHESRSY